MYNKNIKEQENKIEQFQKKELKRSINLNLNQKV